MFEIKSFSAIWFLASSIIEQADNIKFYAKKTNEIFF